MHKSLWLVSHMLPREITQKLTILITATRQSARSTTSPTLTFENIDPEVFFDDLHLNNKIGTKRLVGNIKSRIGWTG